MKREDITKLFPEATDEQVSALLDLNSKDTDAMQHQIDEYRQAESARIEAEKAAAAHADIEHRFDAAVGERKFLHEFVRKSVLDEFEKALADEVNKGKDDQGIFESLTKEKGFFASQNPPVNMGRLGSIHPGDMEELAIRGAFGFRDAT